MDKSATDKSRTRAPVLVSVYDRRKHLEACIEALKKNPEAKDTPLYIVSDGWQHEGHRAAIEDVREYINTITGFKEVNTLFRKSNWGMRRSGPDGFRWVFETHDRLIRMEDDIICSPHYLQYMNDGLTTFESDQRIFSICAHTTPKFKPPQKYPHDIFLWNSFAPWGFAIWKNRWTNFIEKTKTEPKQMRNNLIWRKFKKIRPSLTPRKNYLENNIHNDSRTAVHIFLNNKLSVFPTHTLTINAGMDGSGTHCGLGWSYPKQFLHDAPICIEKNIAPSKRIYKLMYKANYSFLNHSVGSILKQLGIFDPLYALLQKLFRLKKTNHDRKRTI